MAGLPAQQKKRMQCPLIWGWWMTGIGRGGGGEFRPRAWKGEFLLSFQLTSGRWRKKDKEETSTWGGFDSFVVDWGGNGGKGRDFLLDPLLVTTWGFGRIFR